MPGPGWVGLDPTNNILAGERHIRVAIGRDYADVPPTRGVYKGESQSELGVSVTVTPTAFAGGAGATDDITATDAKLITVTVTNPTARVSISLDGWRINYP